MQRLDVERRDLPHVLEPLDPEGAGDQPEVDVPRVHVRELGLLARLLDDLHLGAEMP